MNKIRINYLLLLFLSVIFVSLSLQAQEKQDPENHLQYWFLQKNDTLLGVNYIELSKFIKSENIVPKKQIIVSVIDAGFDFSHLEIKDLIWTNKEEKAANNIDDDCNGYVDDIHGWNFLGNTSGENIQKVATAAFREYKYLRKTYSNVDTSSLTMFEKQEYDHYKKMEREAKLDTYIQFEKYLASINQIYNISDSLMTECYGNKQTTVKDFYELEVEDTTGVMEPLSVVALNILAFPKDKLWSEVMDKNRAEYELANTRVKSLDDHADDPHLNIGNDPEDFQDFRYGNNQIHIDPYHGTMVAGLVGLAHNKGLADIKIMGIRAIPDGDEYDKDIVAAIRYSVDNGAKVINMSFGKKHSLYNEEVETAIKYAQKHDVLIVKASGNDGLNTELYPSYPKGTNNQGDIFENIIIVGSSLKSGTLAPFSNYGAKTVDILAPGEEITSISPDNKYDKSRGTSLSAPIVTGIAALLRSYFPELTALEIKEILMETSTDVADIKTQLPGKDSEVITMKFTNRAGGIVNVLEAFKEASRRSN